MKERKKEGKKSKENEKENKYTYSEWEKGVEIKDGLTGWISRAKIKIGMKWRINNDNLKDFMETEWKNDKRETSGENVSPAFIPFYVYEINQCFFYCREILSKHIYITPCIISP